MEQREFGQLGAVSVLTLGGGGIGQVWGATTRQESVATVKAAVDAGITLLDMAPGYGRGEAEQVVGAAFAGRLPEGVRVTTKHQLGAPAPEDVHARMEASLRRSLENLCCERVDLFFLHSNVCPDGYVYARNAQYQSRFATPWSLYVNEVVPAMERLRQQGLIGAWGITGTGLPSQIERALELAPKPAAVQIVANLMDALGNMRQYDDEPPRPRALIEAAKRNGVGVMGIRAVAAGSLCGEIDRELPDDEATVLDYRSAEPFRALCARLGVSPALLAHRYSLSMPGVDTVVLGVKNRAELAECAQAARLGVLSASEMADIDALGLQGV